MRHSNRAMIAIATLIITSPSFGTAQPWTPSPPSNLKVFAKGSAIRDVLPAMKRFTQALGVRCQHCHVYKGTDPDDLNAFDFASDEKPTKVTTRAMMKMVTAINDDHLKGVGEAPVAGQPKVTCYTCHRGDKRPLTERPPA